MERPIKAIIATVAGTSAFLATCVTAFAEPIPDFIKEGSVYAASRDKLKQEKWLPFGVEVREEGACPDSDGRCKNFSEARECSGTGMGFCNMVWKHEDGTILVIVTAGEEDLTIVSASLEQ